MRGLIALLLLACVAAAARADDLAQQLGRRLERHAVLRAEFTQVKQMAAFKKPLVSKGRMTLVRERGVIWKIESPLRMTYVLAEGRITEIAGDGTAQVRSAQEVPGIAQIGTLFRGLLGARFDTLGDTFALQAEGRPEAWRIALTPKPEAVRKFIRRIALEGGAYVDSIRIEEANGDTSGITFSNTRGDSAASAEERALFGGG